MVDLGDYALMSDFYPKCRKCGSFRLSRYEELKTDRPTRTDDGKPYLWLGNALLMRHYTCLDCGEKDTDFDDVVINDEKLLP